MTTLVVQDLFGEKRITIKDNPRLELIANHVYKLVSQKPELLTGKKVGEINRKVALALYFDNGLENILKIGTKEAFSEWFMKQYTQEEIARATRELILNNYIHIDPQIIRQSERDRILMSQKMRR